VEAECSGDLVPILAGGEHQVPEMLGEDVAGAGSIAVEDGHPDSVCARPAEQGDPCEVIADVANNDPVKTAICAATFAHAFPPTGSRACRTMGIPFATPTQPSDLRERRGRRLALLQHELRNGCMQRVT
jgi:hypothetical protein